MKWLRTLLLFDRGNIASSIDWQQIHDSYVRSIQSIDFPERSGTLTLRKKFKRPDSQWERNGVVFLKRRFLDHIVNVEKWRPEVGFDLGKNRVPTQVTLYPGLEQHNEPVTSDFGNFDLITTTTNGLHVAIEWETGNISSSHRSMNKLAIALVSGKIHAGILILPSRSLYEHLTDRIGNIGELSGYLPMWKDLGVSVSRGLLAISIVEHDELTDDANHPYLPVGSDGRAKEGKAKKR
ncbi:MAG: hypothetical protein V4525_17160 [Pseudomonadota bacterium]